MLHAISKWKEPMRTTEKLNSTEERKDKEENKLKMTFWKRHGAGKKQKQGDKLQKGRYSKHWIETTENRQIVKNYSKWNKTSSVHLICYNLQDGFKIEVAIIELESKGKQEIKTDSCEQEFEILHLKSHNKEIFSSRSDWTILALETQ